ncbi:MAG: hypothetical protein QOK43_2830 [Acidimicrobiaceae bacterium]|nr:hypothetical protein [Acidimicrobiaceae bacterium]
MRKVLIFAVGLTSLVVSGCSGGGNGRDATNKATTTTVASTSSTASTTTSMPTTTTAPPGPPVAAPDPKGLAAQAAEAEAVIHDPQADDAALRRAGWTEQVVSRALARQPSLVAPTLAAVSDAAGRAAIEANAKAGAELLALTKPRPALPDWRIVAPAPADELLAYYKAAEREVGVPWSVLASIHFVETKLGRIRGTSTAGAQGPMQFLPATWEHYGNGGDINSNHDAILAAARLLKANGAPARLDDALFRYNHSAHYVTAVKLYAQRMAADERAFRGYYGWQVYYRMADGDRVLPEGFPATPPLR